MGNGLPTQLTSARLCDIGIVVKDLEKTVNRLEMLGMGPFVPARPPEGAEGLYYRGEPIAPDMRSLVTHLGDVDLEVFEPKGKPNPWEEFLNVKGEGIQHIGFMIDDVEKEVSRLTALGAEATLTGRANGKMVTAHVDLKAANIFFELRSYQDAKRPVPTNKVFSRPWAMAVLVKDMDKTVKRLKELEIGEFSTSPAQAPEGAEGLFFNDKPLESKLNVRILRVGNMLVELVQPDDIPNPWTGFLNRKGEGIHHIDFEVDGVEQEVSRLTGMGAEVVLYGKIRGRMGDAYVDLKTADFLVELTSFSEI